MITIISFLVIGATALGILLWNKSRKGFFAKTFIEADAIVLSIHPGSISLKEEIQAVIQLQVQPERGKSFVGETKKMLSMTDYMKLQAGTRIRVRYYLNNHKELSIIKENFPGELRPVAGAQGQQSIFITK